MIGIIIALLAIIENNEKSNKPAKREQTDYRWERWRKRNTG